jgi:hypothetical protein
MTFKNGVATLALLLAMVAPAIAQSPLTPLEQRNESVIRQRNQGGVQFPEIRTPQPKARLPRRVAKTAL